jgi:hypothetical protein
MRFLGALFVGVCYANGDPVTPLNSEQPKETKASVDARLSLVAVCPEATSNCSVPTGPVAQNEELADALDCMLRINLTTIDPGPCHDALEQFLNDHLNPLNRLMPQMPPGMPQFPMGPQFPMEIPPQFPMSPTMLIMRSQQSQSGPMPMPLEALLQRMARPQSQPMVFVQDPRSQSPFQNSRFQPPQSRYSPEQVRSSSQIHGFPMSSPMDWMSRYRDKDEDRFDMRRFDDYDEYSPSRDRFDMRHFDKYAESRPSHDRFDMRRFDYDEYGPSRDRFDMRRFDNHDEYSPSSRWGKEDKDDGHWDFVWHSTRHPESYSSYPASIRGSHGMSPSRQMPSPRHMPLPSRHMPLPSRHMPPPPPPSRHGSMPLPSRHGPMPLPSRHMPPPSRHMSSRFRDMPSRSSRDDSSSSMLSPMMMMMLPRIMSQGSSSQNPMSGLLMAALMKKMSSSSDSDEYDDYDYDYGYDYDNDAGSDEYDYEDESEADSSPSPLSSIIQQMLQQRLMAAREPAVEVSLNPQMAESDEVDASSLEFPEQDPRIPSNVEIAYPPRVTREAVKEMLANNEQVSYRNAP